jgi:hypothetical protein
MERIRSTNGKAPAAAPARLRPGAARALLGLLAGAVLAAALPQAAAADRGWGRRERDERHERHERRERWDHHERRERWRHERHERHERYRHAWRARPYPVIVHGRACPPSHGHHPFLCRPCGHRFDRWDAFHAHVHHHHHVPLFDLPRLIVWGGVGWVFGG